MQRQQAHKMSSTGQFAEHELVFMMGEELKKPLTAIKILSENNDKQSIIALEARRALRTIDNVLFYQQLSSDQTALDLTPVHVGSTITDVASELQPLSIIRGCETEVFIQSGIATVDADRDLLKSGLESLWQAVLTMTQRPSPLSWHVTKTSKGIRIVVLNNSIDLSKLTMSSLSSKARISRQPMSGSAGPATDLLAAYGMFELLGAKLKKVKQDKGSGLGVTLPISKQLTLV